MADARLQVTDALGRRVVPISKPIFTIGRRSSSDLQLISTDISRDHAEIRRTGDIYVLRDRGARYGVSVNGATVSERRLVHGDRIRLGHSVAVDLVFLVDDDEPPVGSTVRGNLRQIAAVLDSLRTLSSGKVLDEVLTLVMDSALEATNADRGFIMLANPASELEFRIARGRGRVTFPGDAFATSRKIPQEVFASGQSRFFDDLQQPNFAVGHVGTVALGIRHVACVPLRVIQRQAGTSPPVAEAPIGVLYLDGKERGALRSEETRTALEAFAIEAAFAIESARLYSEEAERARLERDLRIAAEIQHALQPEPRYVSAHWELAAVSVPSRTIGGDFFDYLELTDGRFGFALADVAGKGPPAALLSVAAQSTFVAQAALATDPADTMVRINAALLRRAVEGRFATMFYGMLTPEGRLSYCNAGHEPPVLVARRGIQSLETGGVVLGLFPGARYETGMVDLEKGDWLVLYSDGVTEARSRTDEEFGHERLVSCLRAGDSRNLDPSRLLDDLLEAIRNFTAGAPQADDLTAMVLKYTGDGATGLTVGRRPGTEDRATL
jgi:serine phosphatase RsbU (regulator of sigma subunit)/pSer/pThr/pTyr-binding forkhead associated (FHA) protein